MQLLAFSDAEQGEDASQGTLDWMVAP